ncbi:phosphatidylinositol 3-kinase [Capsaspora owczarzaki ATCC 30864]|uniref:phosphatidylinositol 3-kinase n=1 Tax=Capsaspora owczarzaki (strain ATCC 30864) TaxID=595528 RepID=A0A0D2X2A0_CAPO3|nr:phosphatidylinositol 3-kinase [Capsaspora owczarzaki ATCC 30864]
MDGSGGVVHERKPLTVNCLMPHGLVLSVETMNDVSLAEFKDTLKKPDQYAFLSVNDEGDIEDLVEDSQLLRDVRLFKSFIKIAERRGGRDKEDKLMEAHIATLIGSTVKHFDNAALDAEEIPAFRKNMISVCQQASDERAMLPKELLSLAPSVDLTEIPAHIKSKLKSNGTLLVNVWVLNPNHNTYTKFTLPIEAESTPEKLVVMGLRKAEKSLNLPSSEPAEHAMKVRGRQEYLFGSYRLIDYTHVRMCLAKDLSLDLTLIKREDVLATIPETTFQLPSWYTHASVRAPVVWQDDNLDMSSKVRIKIVGSGNINAGNVDGLYIKAGLYHGGQPICPTQRTAAVAPVADPTWNEELVFDISLEDVPRDTRVCVTIHGMWNTQVTEKDIRRPSVSVHELLRPKATVNDTISLYASKRENRVTMAWVNCTLFDFKGDLRGGEMTLSCWPCDPDKAQDSGNPIGTTLPNPDRNTAPFINCAFTNVDKPTPVPPSTVSPQLAAELAEIKQNKPVPEPAIAKDAERLQKIVTRDPLARMTKKDKALVWKYRLYLRKDAKALPKFIRSVPWNKYELVAQAHALLEVWERPTAEDALELLDSEFADARVRAYGVACLDKLSDDKVMTYLSQLVQVLKYEPYFDCELARYLLRRALRNQRIGHFFFWYLRAEMHLPDVAARFALLIEAYCRGCGSHMSMLARQVNAMDKLEGIANLIKRKDLDTREKKLTLLRAEITSTTLPTFQTPLNPTVVVRKLIPEKCSFMDSKKLPLWLVFENDDPDGEDVYIIFKVGDDLRQDMLTLQMIALMDNLWQSEGLDLRMIPYGCLSTGDNTGMIEVVMNSNTVCNIQKDKGGGAHGAFKDDPLYKWLVEKNPDEKATERAVEMFMLSCAGYCVATYVLGIGDRHNDNIMMNKSGQLFHIDFGHFLGNFKSKFGVKRERVPFVLTPDFVYVMSQKEGTKGERFLRFTDLCEKSYLILRRHANLFINLFAMMMSTGIPQLSCSDDINYLRDALRLGSSDEAAAIEFRKKIDEALAKCWSTRLNWTIHGMVH